MFKRIKPYLKSVVMILGFGATLFVAAAAGDNRVDTSEWFNVVIQTVGIIPVYYVFDSRYSAHAKAVVAGAVGALTLAASYHVGGIDGVEWVQIVLSFLTAAGVLAFKNAPLPNHPSS